MIGLCTDSTAQLPPGLRDRLGCVVVPVTVSVDGVEYLEGVDLDALGFWARFADGNSPDVTTTHPSAGQFALAYEEMVAAGCTEILSIHIGSAMSGTVNSARLGGRAVDVPIRVVDSATAGFALGCCVWAAADALAEGADLEAAATVAEQTAASVESAAVVGSIEHARRSGRATLDHEFDAVPEPTAGRIPVVAMRSGHVSVRAWVDTRQAAIDAIVAAMPTDGPPIRVGIGVTDAAAIEIGDAVAMALAPNATIVELVRYLIGPSVGVSSGPGTVGVVWYSPQVSEPS